MTETERIAMTAAFMTAVVVAGLSLSYVPHVELVTLVVFASGFMLGSRQGALVGAVGMPLYVFANSAVKGFPPSPLPVLLAQSVGMAIPGLCGGWWRAFWLAGGVPRRSALLLLPVLGVMLAALNQGLLNFAFVMIMSDTAEPRTAMFLSGMAFGVMDMVWNGVVFSLAGPAVVSMLRRMARTRRWWPTAVLVGLLLLGNSQKTNAQAPALADTVYGAPVREARDPAAADSTDSTDSTEARPAPEQEALRGIDLTPSPLWKPFPVSRASILGVSNLLRARTLELAEISLVAPPSVPVTVDRWAMGWGRVHYTYDGLPLRGPIHGFDEPPDVPFAWRGTWHEKWNATGTSIAIPSPEPAGGAPLSQISLTTGSLSGRTAEFTLFRNLGPVNLGLDFEDRQGAGRFQIDEVQEVKKDRVWLHLRPVKGKRPAWTLDLSMASERQSLANGIYSDRYFSGADMKRGSRRLQGSLTGPFIGGETRFAGQWRRQTIQTNNMVDAFGEVVFDGFTLQGDWVPPAIPGLNIRARLEQDRRRGGLPEDATFTGVYGDATWNGMWGSLGVAAEGTIGHQEPFGLTWEGSFMAELTEGPWLARAVVSHEEDLPSLVVGLDRPTPVSGMWDHLDDFELVSNPESRSAIRLEGTYGTRLLQITVGGWAGWQWDYLQQNNPVWAFGTEYEPLRPRSRNDAFVGLYSAARLELPRGFFVQGRGRIHDRDRVEVPYLTEWTVEGSLHWRRRWFRGTLLLDASIGGTVLGPRWNPDDNTYVSTGLGYVELLGRVDNGVVTISFQNLTDGFVESSLRGSNSVTPIAMTGRTVTVGLTMYLVD